MALGQLLSMRSVAQLCPVVRIASFFDDTDIAAVLKLGGKHADLYGPAQVARRGWTTQYLSADGLLREHEAAIFNKLQTLPCQLNTSIISSGDGTSVAALAESLKVRCAGLHCGTTRGSLNDPKHFDRGSVVTVDVMLEDGFEGGEFQTLQAGGGGAMKHHVFRRGDALVFPSLKYHSVAPITSGVRKASMRSLSNCLSSGARNLALLFCVL